MCMSISLDPSIRFNILTALWGFQINVFQNIWYFFDPFLVSIPPVTVTPSGSIILYEYCDGEEMMQIVTRQVFRMSSQRQSFSGAARSD